MRNLIEEAAARLQQLQQDGLSDRWADVVETDARLERVGSSVFPIARRFPAPLQRESSRLEIDLSVLAERGMLTPHAAQPEMANEYRILKRPLIRNASSKGGAGTSPGRFVMVTSAQSGEGKTFNAVNLAMSIAMEMDRSVLLVDADVLHPSLSSLLGLPRGPGLLDVLAETADVADALIKTQVEGLSIIPNGNPNPRATELLASRAMSALLDELTARDPDRLVIFDAPPLLASTEARELASHMGQLIVVVQADRTLQSEIRQALSIVEGVPRPMLLLNGVRRHGRDQDTARRYGGELSDPDGPRE